MAFYNDRILDLGLNILSTEADALHLCSEEPADFTEATATFSLANKPTIDIPAPVAMSPNGRKVVVPAIVDGDPGVVTDTGTATHYAIVDTANSRLLVTGTLATPQVLTDGNSFTVAALDIGLIGPA